MDGEHRRTLTTIFALSVPRGAAAPPSRWARRRPAVSSLLGGGSLEPVRPALAAGPPPLTASRDVTVTDPRFTDELRRLRQERRLSYRALADRAHHAKSYVEDLEKGR